MKTGFTIDNIYPNLSDADRNRVLFKVQKGILQKYPITANFEEKVKDVIHYYESIEEYELCLELVSLIADNKKRFNYQT